MMSTQQFTLILKVASLCRHFKRKIRSGTISYCVTLCSKKDYCVDCIFKSHQKYTKPKEMI